MLNSFLNDLGLKILPSIISIYLNTLRIKIYKAPSFDSNSVFIFWHSKMLIGWWILRNKKLGALVSKSKDGEILSSILNKWNYKVVRGSSSKAGKEALHEIINFAKTGNSVVLTPDGPRGPAGYIKNGALVISYECQIPIIPVKIFNYNKKILFKSWDKFEIPFPFSKCQVHFGKKHYYKQYLYNNELDEFKQSMSNEM
jgi:lysophospholipid acyltransferase (LPLAT)-like uncharacterized protein